MYELIQVKGNSYYIDCPAKIGLYRISEDEVCLIDSGNDKDAAKRVRRLLDERGWRLKAIYNTHSNADHIGGNRYLVQNMGARVYAPGMERDLTEHTLLEPALLYGGFPPRELRHKFLMAEGVCAEPLTAEVLPLGFEIVELPGHFLDMVGFRTPDGVVYLADCLSSRAALDKYAIGVVLDVEGYLKTLERVAEMEADAFVPSHAEPTADIRPLAEYNAERVREVADAIVECCREPICFDMLLGALFRRYALKMTFEQHALVGSTVRSYLSYLSGCGRVKAVIEEDMLLWAAV